MDEVFILPSSGSVVYYPIGLEGQQDFGLNYSNVPNK